MLEQKLWLNGQQVKRQLEYRTPATLNELSDATFRQEGAVMEWKSSRLLPFSVAAARTAVWQCRTSHVSATKLDLVSRGLWSNVQQAMLTVLASVVRFYWTTPPTASRSSRRSCCIPPTSLRSRSRFAESVDGSLVSTALFTSGKARATGPPQ